MVYFNNPRTEEELKEQFRKLLIQHDYRNPKNEKLINAIRAEYEEYSMQIKRANGYLPFEEKVANVVGMVKGKVKDYIDEEKMEQQRERQRIATLKNHKYTKQEFTDLLNQEKRCIEQIVIAAIKDFNTKKDQSPYRMLRSSIAFSDTFDDLYLSFTERVENQEVAADGKQYHNLREAIEYAAESLSPNKRQYEELMAKVETMMGKYFYQSFIKYEEMYIDPVIIQEFIGSGHKISDRKETKSSGKHIFLKLTILAGIAFIIFSNIAEYLGGYEMKNGTESSLTLIFSILTLISGAVAVLAGLMGLGFFVAKPLEKQKRRARTHNAAVASENAGKILVQLMRMFLH